MIRLMYHSAPNAYELLAARIGATVILQPHFDPEDLLDLVKGIGSHIFIWCHHAPSAVGAVPRRYDLSSLRFVAHVAAPVSIAVKRAMVDWWGPIIHDY